ncbi:signal transduction histidine kinase, nitrogen specific, NtrB [Anaeromyxobacter sp. K]|uniref:hybrid sensor histidine kinase/response regulator n=1 Tax=Anaeromyxobacter TaxID=161492 RepID=UPI00015F9374|nr:MULTISPECIES: response regulator [Anaeromyxobacter]ACG75558.1 signal transduction histidine kinase, nitrogen specific, NtrB [Anaeromyxobacter sp. K]
MATILIVDDEPVILDVFRRFLEGEGRTLLLAGSAREALARAAEPGDIDVALVDKNLGDGSGLDVARQLKAAKPDVEVILVTGYASLDSAIQAVQIGAFDYVTKPVSDYDALNLKVENAVEKVRMKRSQRELVARLVESEALHRGVFETSSDAILLVDAESGRLEDANPAAERLYGRDRDALRDLRYADLLEEGGGEGGPAAGIHAAPGRHRRADGTAFPVEVTVDALRLHDRGLRVVSVRDMSERERAEAERRELEQNLRQAQKMEAVGRLAGGVAHDFSNVLAVVLGYSELLVRDLPTTDPRLRECADGIIEAAHRAVGVTRQLLTLSRKKLLRPEVLSLNKVVQDLGKLLGRAIGERIEVTTTLQEQPWPVLADADQLAQVLLNLAVNARDAMPDGGPLHIATANVEVPQALRELSLPAGRYVTLTVRDSGMGMTEEVRARIFEPFFTTKETGTGLGLATVYGIVRQAGGAIRVESRPGAGTSFTVYLPAADEAAARVAVAVPVAAPRGLGETVVLAEDEDALRTLLGRVLSGSGYQVISGRNGAEALEAARARGGRVDVLLTDLVMPRMTGAELAEALTPGQPGMKVLFMTGHTDDVLVQDRLVDGDVELIQKPFTSEALLAHLRRLLGPPRVAA